MKAGSPGDVAPRILAGAISACLAMLLGCSPPVPEPGFTTPEGAALLTTDERNALLYRPARRTVEESPGLIVVLHGYTGEAAGTVDFFGLRPVAEERNLLILAPQGTADVGGEQFWNASDACCDFGGTGVDDDGYLSGLIATVTSSEGVDPERVFVVGHSNGGFMAHTLACRHSDHIAAIASLAGALDDDFACTPTSPVSVLQIHGTIDDTVQYDGGGIGGWTYTSAEDTVARWATADRCREGPFPADAPTDADTNVPGDDLTAVSWTGCNDGTEVSLWTIEGGGHLPSLSEDASRALVAWLEAHPRRY